MAGIYIASKGAHAARWRALRESGVPVVSSWIDEPSPATSMPYPEAWRLFGVAAREAHHAAAVIVYVEGEEQLNAAWVGVGAALAVGRPVFAVGFGEPPEPAYPEVLFFDTFEDALERALRCCSAAPEGEAADAMESALLAVSRLLSDAAPILETAIDTWNEHHGSGTVDDEPDEIITDLLTDVRRTAGEVNASLSARAAEKAEGGR